MGSGTFITVGYFEYHCCTDGCLPVMEALREFVRRLKQECHMYLDGQQAVHLQLLGFFKGSGQKRVYPVIFRPKQGKA